MARFKIVASGCDQCVCVCGGSRRGLWVWSLSRALNDVISGQCVTMQCGWV